MFQGHPQVLQVPFPYKGINTTADNDPTYAKFTQNILSSDNKTGRLRFGTNLSGEFAFNPTRAFGDIISVMSFLQTGGTAQKLVYLQYLTAVEHLDIVNHVTVAPSASNSARSTITIDISSYTDAQKQYFSKVFFDNVYLYIRQISLNNGADIINFQNDGNHIVFDVPFKEDYFDKDISDPFNPQNNFEFWIERGGIYKLNDDSSFELIVDDLDPNVIVSHVNFQGKLLIANGVDPVKIYDGENVEDLKGTASMPYSGNAIVAGLDIKVNVAAEIITEVQNNVVIGSHLELITDTQPKDVTVTNIVFAAPANGIIEVTITVDDVVPAGVRKILYRKTCPAFSYITIAHRRLWALAEGRSYKNKFRSPDLAMKVYYTTKQDSVDGWFNEKTNQIDYIDMSTTAFVPDNLEMITQFDGKMLFLGRETTQVWEGEDPTVIEDGQNINLPDFKWERTLPVGIIQKTLFVEIPNAFVFLSKFGIIALSSINVYQQIEVSDSFSAPIDHHLNNQLAFIDTERDYRNMKAFLYPYGRFVGFRIKYSCFIYQLASQKAWTLFSENFAEARSFFYDATEQNLFLGLPKGKLLTYADKIQNQSFEEYGKGKISWCISYNWIYTTDTWNNTHVYTSAATLKPLTIDVRCFLNHDESKSIMEKLVLEQQGVMYDVAQFDQKPYSNLTTAFAHESVRFSCDSIMLELKGLSGDLFIFDRLILAGGTQTGKRGGA